jgi:glycyl-tRNA synthetase beta chain
VKKRTSSTSKPPRSAHKRAKRPKTSSQSASEVFKALKGEEDLLFEIGVEELPPSYIYREGGLDGAIVWLKERIVRSLTDHRIEFPMDCVHVWGTPRRLIVYVARVGRRQSDAIQVVQGPSATVAFDAAGQPTKALMGFCKAKGLDPADVSVADTPKGKYVEAKVRLVGLPTAKVLPDLLASIASRIPFPKVMRWTTPEATEAVFARPVRWLAALYGDEILAVKAFGLTADRITFGHRFLHPDPIRLSEASAYKEMILDANVMVDHTLREDYLRQQLDRQAAAVGGAVVTDNELVEINNFLVEWPTVFEGHFDPRYLDLPREVIVTALREHQRFFAVENSAHSLLPIFLAVRNGDDKGLEQVRKGAEHVLTARLEDARFYWETDLKHPPIKRMDALASVVWLEGLGTLREKAQRLADLAGWLASSLAPEAEAASRRAALLSKTDLLSEMIGSGKEYASLEGIIGAYYARRAGEPEQVTSAIAEHYRPRGPADKLPTSQAGAILSIADKLDHVAGAFVSGKIPSGSEDPYGVRRAGNGVLRILLEQERHLNLRSASMEATRPFVVSNPDLSQAAIMDKLREFWSGRVWSRVGGGEWGQGEAFYPWHVEAAMAARMNGNPGWADPYDCLIRTRALSAFRSDPRFESLVVLYRRVDNILKAAKEPLPADVDEVRITETAEKELLSALRKAFELSEPLWERKEYWQILPVLLELEHAIHSFFDHVLVNVEDPSTRTNRLRLLTDVRALFLRGWDLSLVVVEGEKV